MTPYRSVPQLCLDNELAVVGHGGSILSCDGGWAWTAHRGHEQRSGWCEERAAAEREQRAAIRSLYGLPTDG